MLNETLSKLGFSPSEIKIYIHLLEKEGSYPNKISTEIKINRTNVYEALDRLVSKGLVSFITKNKVKWYEARSLKSINEVIKIKEEKVKNIKKQLAEDIAKFEKIKKSNKTPLEATIFTGKKGLRTLFEEIINTKKEVSLMASELQFKEFFGDYFELWHMKRITNKIKQKSIFPLKIRKKLKKRALLQYRFTEDKFINPTTTILYGNVCLFIQWAKEPLAIRIQSLELAKSHKNYFNLMWKIAKK